MKILLFFLLGVVALPLIFLVAALEGVLPTNSLDSPSRLESVIGMKALDASLEKRSDALASPSEPKNAGARARGHELFVTKCSACHGTPNGPSDLGKDALYPRAPQFFEEGTDVTVPEAYSAIRDGIRYSGMPAWKSALTDRQIWDLATFVVTITPRRPMAPMH